MADDDRRQTEAHPERPEDVDDRRLQRQAGDDARQGNREDDGERDYISPEEAIPRHGHRGECPENEGDCGRTERGENGEHQRFRDLVVVEGDGEPPRTVVLDRPALGDVPVERVESDQDQRQVDECKGEYRAGTQQDAARARLDHQSDSKARSRRATRR